MYIIYNITCILLLNNHIITKRHLFMNIYGMRRNICLKYLNSDIKTLQYIDNTYDITKDPIYNPKKCYNTKKYLKFIIDKSNLIISKLLGLYPINLPIYKKFQLIHLEYQLITKNNNINFISCTISNYTKCKFTEELNYYSSNTPYLNNLLSLINNTNPLNKLITIYKTIISHKYTQFDWYC